MVIIPPRKYQWTGARMEVRRLPAIVENPWRPCPTCWSQRVIWEETPFGYRAIRCEACLGLGEVMHG
jgi:hypothetical protein